MSPRLKALIEQARLRPITPDELSEQEISFAYGNASFENPDVRREMVREASKRMNGKYGEVFRRLAEDD
jgi:hypothetical protein